MVNETLLQGRQQRFPLLKDPITDAGYCYPLPQRTLPVKERGTSTQLVEAGKKADYIDHCVYFLLNDQILQWSRTTERVGEAS